MKKLAGLFLTGLLAFPSKASNVEIFENVTYVRNYDGDTFTVNIKGLPAVFGNEISVRVAGIDTPEIRGSNICETRRAKIAKDEVSKLFQNAKKVDLINPQRGKYFRLVAQVWIDNSIDLATHLLMKNLAVPYDGGPRPKVDWCIPQHTKFKK